MLTTNELQKYIMSEINDKLDEISYSNVFFEKGDDNSAEGTYIFSTNSNYHITNIKKIQLCQRIFLMYGLVV